MSVNANDVLTVLYKRIVADTILPTADYLDSTGRVEKQPRRREGLTAPCITMKIGGRSVNTESKVEDFIIYINSYAKDLSNGTADTKRLALIGNHVDMLIEDYNFQTLAGLSFRFFNCYVVSPHGEIFFDPDFPDEHYMVTTIRFQAQNDLGVV